MPWGGWKSLQEMEDTLTLEELYLIIDAQYRAQHANRRFMAAMQGVDIDEGVEEARFEDIKRRAEADLAGVSEEKFVFSQIGIEVEADDDD